MIDLHMHSLYSDGTSTTNELVKMAMEKNMKLISLTDHDTIDGLSEMKKLCDENNIKFINGIELSTVYNGKEVHILGYFVNIEDKKLLDFSKEMKKARVVRNEKTIKILNEHGLNITQEDTYKEAEGEIVSKTHLARAIVTKGYAADIAEAFKKYLGPNSIGYVPKMELSPLEGIKIIKDNGGLAFLAHPKLIGLDENEFLNLIKEMKGFGLDGLETYYSTFSSEDIKYYEKISEDFSLIRSAGADFHGANRVGIEIGDNFAPSNLYEIWEEIYEKMKKRG